eukprot:tig00001420_g8688.t1
MVPGSWAGCSVLDALGAQAVLAPTVTPALVGNPAPWDVTRTHRPSWIAAVLPVSRWIRAPASTSEPKTIAIAASLASVGTLQRLVFLASVWEGLQRRLVFLSRVEVAAGKPKPPRPEADPVAGKAESKEDDRIKKVGWGPRLKAAFASGPEAVRAVAFFAWVLVVTLALVPPAVLAYPLVALADRQRRTYDNLGMVWSWACTAPFFRFHVVEGRIGKQRRPREFKRGAFLLAKELGVPIVPVTIVGTGRLMPPAAELTLRCPRHVGPDALRIVVHPPIETAGKSQAELLHATRMAVLSALPSEEEERAFDDAFAPRDVPTSHGHPT